MPADRTDRERERERAKTHKLALKGSSKLVSEFFEYSINTILFQRGVYPPEDFTAVKKYGMNMLVTADDQVKAYIKRIMLQLNRWMAAGKISRLVVVITAKDSGEHVERWQFDVDILKPAPLSSSADPSHAAQGQGQNQNQSQTQEGQENSQPPSSAATPPSPPPPAAAAPSQPQPQPKPDAEIQSEIAALFRQITASVTFLPTLDAFGPCTFNVLVYADADSEVPLEWGDSDAKEVQGGERVALRSFSTAGHKVGVVVGYRLAE